MEMQARVQLMENKLLRLNYLSLLKESQIQISLMKEWKNIGVLWRLNALEGASNGMEFKIATPLKNE